MNCIIKLAAYGFNPMLASIGSLSSADYLCKLFGPRSRPVLGPNYFIWKINEKEISSQVKKAWKITQNAKSSIIKKSLNIDQLLSTPVFETPGH